MGEQKTMRKNSRKGLTGIETAIILIAFVIVASAFAFAVLNIGFQSTQKAQDVIAEGMKQSTSNLELDGAVVAKADTTTGNVTEIRFTVKLSAGKTPIDFSLDRLVISFTTENYFSANIYTAGCAPNPTNPCAKIITIIDKYTNLALDSGDKFEVVIYLPDGAAATSGSLGENDTFRIELKPAEGSVMTVVRTTPLVLQDVMFLT